MFGKCYSNKILTQDLINSQVRESHFTVEFITSAIFHGLYVGECLPPMQDPEPHRHKTVRVQHIY